MQCEQRGGIQVAIELELTKEMKDKQEYFMFKMFTNIDSTMPFIHMYLRPVNFSLVLALLGSGPMFLLLASGAPRFFNSDTDDTDKDTDFCVGRKSNPPIRTCFFTFFFATHQHPHNHASPDTIIQS